MVSDLVTRVVPDEEELGDECGKLLDPPVSSPVDDLASGGD